MTLDETWIHWNAHRPINAKHLRGTSSTAAKKVETILSGKVNSIFYNFQGVIALEKGKMVKGTKDQRENFSDGLKKLKP